MPPTPKFTREDILEASLSIVRESGIEALTARKLAEKLGSSTRPIFTLYQDMDELKTDVYHAAAQLMWDYVNDSKNYTHPFKQEGLLVIDFARKDPMLFRLIHWGPSGDRKKLNTIYLEQLNADRNVIEMLKKNFELDDEQAIFLHHHVWGATYGFALLCSSNQTLLTDEEISQMLSTEFQSILMYVRSGAYQKDDLTLTPERKEV